ncbi:hypothetical protein [Thioalkalivibrio sp. ALE16]|uniref:hypothetical protein n=1 Tax=Thioalkalivibrio sp. ALE16 TaxID=1158172 RepID=UPI00037242EC|nr:hypothetical protein [Thioalkalivibrio sp. ALE16]
MNTELLRDKEILSTFADIPKASWMIQAEMLEIIPNTDSLQDDELEILDGRLKSRIENALKNQGMTQ